MSDALDPTLSPRDKGFPPDSWGRSLSSFTAQRPVLSRMQTPIVALDEASLTHNATTMFDWVRREGLSLAPHGKTTMSPQLWRRLIDAGARGMTFATAWQAQAAREAGIERIMIANAVTDPIGLAWIAEEIARHPDVEISCWVDGADTVRAMEAVLGRPDRKLPVICELGAAGGRTGARTHDEAVRLARRIHDSPALELAGVGGYEGALAHDRSPDGLARVDAYLDAVAALHAAVGGLYRPGHRPQVTAGGSAYMDRVAARLGHLADNAELILRSGAFQIHDDGFYRQISPLGRELDTAPLRSAMHAWVRVVSRPEPALALIDAGKRDLSFDEGLPIPLRVEHVDDHESERLLAGARVSAVNDQHGFLQLGAGVASADLPPGSVIRLGLSHPCTVLDKWRVLPVIADADADDPVIIDAVTTWF